MISIKDKPVGIDIANTVDWHVPVYSSNSETKVVAIFGVDGIPIKNWDGGSIGVVISMPDSIKDNWGTDDTVVEEWLLKSIGATRV